MDGWSILLLLLLLSIGGWVDLRENRIPNLIVLNGILLALTLHGLTNGPQGLAESLAGMVVAGGLLLPYYALGGMGAGDVKLMAMVGAFLGINGAVAAVAMTLLAGLVLGSAVLLGWQALRSRFAGRLLTASRAGLVLRTSQRSEESRGGGALRFPYALAIVAGTLGSLWWHADLEPAVKLVAMLWTP